MELKFLNTQIAEEFSLTPHTVGNLSRDNLEKYMIYHNALLYRFLVDAMGQEIEMEDVGVTKLSEHFGKQPQNFSILKKKGSELFGAYQDCYKLFAMKEKIDEYLLNTERKDVKKS